MNNTNNTTQRTWPSPIVLLTLLFITLKLTNHIDWSWWWVLSPIWIIFSIIGIIFFTVLSFCGILVIVNKLIEHKQGLK